LKAFPVNAAPDSFVKNAVSSSKVGVIREDGHLARLKKRKYGMWEVECGMWEGQKKP
jgi:hypothetical protein